jgi:hypothetical protein
MGTDAHQVLLAHGRKCWEKAQMSWQKHVATPSGETTVCRFLLLAASILCDVRLYVMQFARMCQHSTGLHGEGWPGDG